MEFGLSSFGPVRRDPSSGMREAADELTAQFIALKRELYVRWEAGLAVRGHTWVTGATESATAGGGGGRTGGGGGAARPSVVHVSLTDGREVSTAGCGGGSDEAQPPPPPPSTSGMRVGRFF